jgi:ribosomal protein S18 acetylase RimI-like enzyme
MQPPTVQTVSRTEEDNAVAVMTLGFGGDPTARWIWPEPHRYFTHFPEFVRAYAGGAFDYDSVHGVASLRGFAMWLPPGVHSDDPRLEASVRASVDPERHAEVFALFEEMGSYHPSEPHWFLPLIAVDPACQGSGLGSALLAHMLAQCDRDQHVAYLDSSNPKNVPLYERYGFSVLGEIRSGSCPVVYPMIRMPR